MGARPKVLIVDDNSDVRRLYDLGLNQRGFEVKLAANGAEAVERVADERPDVILLDWVMPLMDGSEVLSRLRELSASGLELTRRALDIGRGWSFKEILEQVETLYLNELMKTEDAREGIQAFMEKRKPEWKSK